MSTPSESAHDILRSRGNPMRSFFAPQAVAVIGASETPGSVGRTLLRNLISSPFGGTVFPVNPKRQHVQGIHCYPSVKELPAPADLAVIATPAATVPGLVRECGECGVPAAIILSAGFREAGPEGAALEQQVRDEARRSGMRLIGPNCLGLMSPLTGLNATFAKGMAKPGSVGFLSQSGALCTAVLDWSLREKVGFSAFVSIGAMCDVGWGDLIDYLGDDPHTRSILLYMETVGDARSFLSAAREVSFQKPVIVIKPGRTQAAARAAQSHTGSMSGSDDVLDAAFRRGGVLRVNRISELFDMAEVLSRQPAPRGNRLTIVTNAGGPAVLATDALVDRGGELAPLDDRIIGELNQVLPKAWSHGNPIDILGDAGPNRYEQALKIAAANPASDGLLICLTPQEMTEPLQTAEILKAYAKAPGKPILASWMGGSEVAAGEEVLNRAGIPTFPYPDTAAETFVYMWRHRHNLNALYETPRQAIATEEEKECRQRVGRMIAEARAAGRTLLSEFESKSLLGCYGIPVVPTRIGLKVENAVRLAEEIGYPVVVKLNSRTITHKSDVNGVWLNLENADQVREAFESIRAAVREKKGEAHFEGVAVQPMIVSDGYELIVGSSPDPQFGPVLLFGTGGRLVEVYRDRALSLPPLTTTLARRMMERTKIHQALQGVRGRPPVDLEELERLLVRFSHLVVGQPAIAEIDINPLLAEPGGRLLALDARVVLHPEGATLPRPAIRPYPTGYEWTWTSPTGAGIEIRPIRPEDEPRMAQFHQTLSERTVYLRYLQSLKLSQRVAHERLRKLCFLDFDREIALVCLAESPSGGEKEIIAVGRLVRGRSGLEAEFAVLVADAWQGQGLGTQLLERLIEVARAEGLEFVTGEILSENYVMQKLCRKLGFEFQRSALGDPTVEVALKL